jgi:hypothetical protein
MAPGQSDEYPSLQFTHRNHEFLITVVPDGADVLLKLSDQYGHIMLPFSTRVTGVQREGSLVRQPIDRRMAELRGSIQKLNDTEFLRFLETPRSAGDFNWTPAELDAVSKIDWSKPAATLVHEAHSFAIGAFVTPERMIFLLSDADGPFDGPLSIPRASIERAEAKGTNPLELGVSVMTERIRTWTASRTQIFVKNTPRLTSLLRANRQAKNKLN